MERSSFTVSITADLGWSAWSFTFPDLLSTPKNKKAARRPKQRRRAKTTTGVSSLTISLCFSLILCALFCFYCIWVFRVHCFGSQMAMNLPPSLLLHSSNFRLPSLSFRYFTDLQDTIIRRIPVASTTTRFSIIGFNFFPPVTS